MTQDQLYRTIAIKIGRCQPYTIVEITKVQLCCTIDKHIFLALPDQIAVDLTGRLLQEKFPGRLHHIQVGVVVDVHHLHRPADGSPLAHPVFGDQTQGKGGIKPLSMIRDKAAQRTRI